MKTLIRLFTITVLAVTAGLNLAFAENIEASPGSNKVTPIIVNLKSTTPEIAKNGLVFGYWRVSLIARNVVSVQPVDINNNSLGDQDKRTGDFIALLDRLHQESEHSSYVIRSSSVITAGWRVAGPVGAYLYIEDRDQTSQPRL